MGKPTNIITEVVYSFLNMHIQTKSDRLSGQAQ